VESWSSGSGIIDWPDRRAGRILFGTFGNYCRSGLLIRETFHRRLIVENQTNLCPENPHPNPLPSDGRGNSQRTGSGIWRVARIFERVLTLSLSHRMGEGRGEGPLSDRSLI
jgi:hypothetical protein